MIRGSFTPVRLGQTLLLVLGYRASCFVNPLSHLSINLPNSYVHHMKDPYHHTTQSKKRIVMVDFVIATPGFAVLQTMAVFMFIFKARATCPVDYRIEHCTELSDIFACPELVFGGFVKAWTCSL